MNWLDLLAVQGIPKSLLQHYSSKALILRCSAFFMVQLSHPYMTTGKSIALTRWTFVGKVMSLLFNMLSRFFIAFLSRSKHLLISWLQSPSLLIFGAQENKVWHCFHCCCCWVTSVVSNSVWPHRRQPTRLPRPWDSPGKNTKVGCHFLLQCMKVKSESEVTQSCPTLCDPWTAAYQAPPSIGFSRQEYWSGVPSPSPLIPHLFVMKWWDRMPWS